MNVTKIEELSKSRSKIYIDQEIAFVLYKGEIRLHKLREGHEISEESYRTIMEEILPKRAKLRTMNLLQSRDYTTQQLRRKLKEGFYPDQIIEEALAYVSSYHYTDDLRYATDYITGHVDSRSRRRIEQDLMGKGIDKNTLEKAWMQWEDMGGRQDAVGMIEDLLRKRKYDPAVADAKERRKIYAYLAGKGFEAEDIRKALATDYLTDAPFFV